MHFHPKFCQSSINPSEHQPPTVHFYADFRHIAHGFVVESLWLSLIKLQQLPVHKCPDMLVVQHIPGDNIWGSKGTTTSSSGVGRPSNDI